MLAFEKFDQEVQKPQSTEHLDEQFEDDDEEGERSRSKLGEESAIGGEAFKDLLFLTGNNNGNQQNNMESDMMSQRQSSFEFNRGFRPFSTRTDSDESRQRDKLSVNDHSSFFHIKSHDPIIDMLIK